MRNQEPDAIEGTAREPLEHPLERFYDPREHDEQLSDDAVARQLGYDSFDDAPPTVQRTIENRDVSIEDPFAPLRRGDR